MRNWFQITMLLSLAACTDRSHTVSEAEKVGPGNKLFTKVTASHSGITFRNDVDDLGKYTPHNTYYIYNGGGIAVGDIDNDGLDDLLFSSNQNGCRLYRNLGDFRFEDITEKAGINYGESWTTGVCMVDVNADGWMDMHICRSGLAPDTNWTNLLYINNGDATFSEQATAYGLDDLGTSTQVHFFDIDRDGDLDAYVLNHPVDFENSFDPFFQVKALKDSIYSNRFYLNENGRFIEANSLLGVEMEKGFSLSASIGDINEDGWPDVYVANDFISPDHYYINQQGKGFVDRVTEVLDKTTLFSMGSDLADVNNDGHLDLFVADMEPRDHFRRKNNNFNLDKSYYDLVRNRFSYSQFTRNMFYAGSPAGFREIGHLAGVAMTDWTWATLFADLDNDGLKDLFTVNGTKRDFHDLDYAGLDFDQSVTDSKKRHGERELIENMPVSLLPNHAFRNTDELRFEDVSSLWGLDDALNGQGAVVADLNNDGALDIVVNNTDAEILLYRNNGTDGNHHISIDLHYIHPNPDGIGTKVEVYTGSRRQLQFQYPIRGFQSSVSTTLHFGLGKDGTIDSLLITWPDGQIQKMTTVAADRRMTINYGPNSQQTEDNGPILWFDQRELAEFNHVENDFDEVQRDRIVPFGLSRSGPAMAAADLNADGLTDLIIGSSIGQRARILFGQENGTFTDSGNLLMETEQKENTALLIIDIDKDGDPDIYVGNGSNEAPELNESLRDQVYLNNGEGRFELDQHNEPEPLLDTRCAVAIDIDRDGSEDIFIGAGFVPGEYGRSSGSRVLMNENGSLVDATESLAPDLNRPSAVHDATVADLDGDGTMELLTLGPWDEIRRFGNVDGKLSELDPIYAQKGLWNEVHVVDLNADGHPDVIAGNQGLNGIFRASPEQPLELLLADFDRDGTADPVVTHYLNGRRATFVGKDDFCEKMPTFNNRFLTYRQFAESDVAAILTGTDVDLMAHRQVQELETIVLLNDGKGGFSKAELPRDAQFAPVKAIHVIELAGDSMPGILLFGNSDSEFYDQGPIRANHGCVLQMDGSGKYVAVSSDISGINVEGVVSSSVGVNDNGIRSIILGRNDAALVQLIPIAGQ